MINSRHQVINLTKFPSVIAESQQDGLTDRYQFVPTTRVVNALAKHNWLPATCRETKVRNKDGVGYQKHIIHFRNNNDVTFAKDLVVGDTIPEIVLTNSHDGKASFEIMAGLLRLACTNGLMVADSTYATHKIRHIGYADEAVSDAVAAILGDFPKITKSVGDFRNIELSKEEKEIYAHSALLAKYGEPKTEEDARHFDINMLLEPQRREDNTPTLWSTYNVVQEKFTKGARYEHRKNKIGVFSLRKNKAITNIKEDIRINRALWSLTEKMAELKQGGKITNIIR